MAKEVIVTLDDHRIPIPTVDVRGFIANALKVLEWREINTPRDMKRVTASQMDQIKGHSVYDYQYLSLIHI